MTDTTGANTSLEPSGVPFRRRLVLAAGNLGFFVLAAFLMTRLARSFAGEGTSWWIRVLIVVLFVMALVVVDVLLRAALLRPARRSPAEPGAGADRPRERRVFELQPLFRPEVEYTR